MQANSNVLFGGRGERLAIECVYLVQHTMYGTGSGCYDERCAVWCSISASVVAMMSGVLYGAAVVCTTVVGTTMCVHVRNNSWSSNSGRYLCVEWCVELRVAQCWCVELSCRATHSQMYAE